MSSDTSSIIINLETLQKKYTNLLTAYTTAVTDYIQYITVQSACDASSSCLVDFVTIKGHAYTGTGSAGNSDASTLQECTASCSSTAACSGATFVSDKCVLRTGDSPIVNASAQSYAIVPKKQQLLMNMETLNAQLIQTNEELMNAIQKAEVVYYKTSKETKKKNEELKQSYSNLVKERSYISEMLREYETIDATETEQQIKITQNYYSYIFLVIIVIVILIAFMKILSYSSTPALVGGDGGGNLGFSALYIILGMVLLICCIKYFSM